MLPIPRLISALWEENPPTTATKQVQNCVSGLRERLTGYGSTSIETDGPGYRIQVDDEHLDLLRFRRGMNRARKLSAAGDLAKGAAEAGQALALWRGPVLDGIGTSSLADRTIGITEQGLVAFEECAEWKLSLGANDEVVNQLTQLVAQHPLRERLCAQLMVALGRSGRSAEALLVFHRLRRRLQAELGVGPAAEVQAAYESILRKDVTSSTQKARSGRHPHMREDGGAPGTNADAAPTQEAWADLPVASRTLALPHLGTVGPATPSDNRPETGPTVLRGSRQPPAPVWCGTLTNWRTAVDQAPKPPELGPATGGIIGPDDPRLLFHGNMRPVRTPAISSAELVVHRQLMANARRTRGRIGILVDGPANTGKSELLAWIGQNYERRINERYGPNVDRIPVIALSVPAKTGGSRDWPASFARFLGLDHEQPDRDPTDSVCYIMRHCHTQLVLIDGMERLEPGADTEHSLAFLKYISDETGATFVYCGRNSRAIVERMSSDHEKPLAEEQDRWHDHPLLMTSPLGFDRTGRERLHHIVNEFDKDLRLHNHQPGDLAMLASQLHRRSKGYMRALSQLICQAAQEAILTGEERITPALFEGLAVGKVIAI